MSAPICEVASIKGLIDEKNGGNLRLQFFKNDKKPKQDEYPEYFAISIPKHSFLQTKFTIDK